MSYIVGQLDCIAGVNNLVTVDRDRTCNVLFSNRSSTPVTVSLSIAPQGVATPSNAHCIEPSVSLDANCVIERGGIPMGTGDQFFINPSASGLSVTVVGIPIR